MPQVAPYGTWDSPISAGMSVCTEDVLVDSVTSAIYYVEKRPQEGGRNVLVRGADGMDVFGREWNARTAVHEYGGASVVIHRDVVLFSNFADAQVYRLDLASDAVMTPKPVTAAKDCRFASFSVHPVNANLVVSIMEDHTNPAPKHVVNTLIYLNLLEAIQSPVSLLAGADFYATPTFNPDEQVYIAAVEIVKDRLALAPNRLPVMRVAGFPSAISAVQPTWTSLDTLLFSCDASSYHNPWLATVDWAEKTVSTRPILSHPLSIDFADPSWWLAAPTTALFSASKTGRSVLHLVSASGSCTEVPSPCVHIERMRRVGPWQVVFLGSQVDRGPEITLCTFPNADDSLPPRFTALAREIAEITPALSEAYISLPTPLELVLPLSPRESVHVVYYLPKNPNYTRLRGEQPPAIINVHGGPTYLEKQSFSLEKQFFTTRGWMWIDVNYSGSSNFGREYANRLKGNWGVTDVRDCVQTVLILSSPEYEYNLIDRNRTVIRGGSAGGYTTLVALSQPGDSATPVFAGTSSYGISDLRKLTQMTHKFQSCYAQTLIGGSFEDFPDRYHTRSPVFQAENISVRLLILQGSVDSIVPPNQAEDMISVIKSQGRGGAVEYVVFEGKGHGWREAETIEKALNTELAFYQRALGLV
ncbi:alpha/beta-hydrolase [Mycena amicta]|nr:alpha/beta-hydrolase [Mycena amicta]